MSLLSALECAVMVSVSCFRCCRSVFFHLQLVSAASDPALSPAVGVGVSYSVLILLDVDPFEVIKFTGPDLRVWIEANPFIAKVAGIFCCYFCFFLTA